MSSKYPRDPSSRKTTQGFVLPEAVLNWVARYIGYPNLSTLVQRARVGETEDMVICNVYYLLFDLLIRFKEDPRNATSEEIRRIVKQLPVCKTAAECFAHPFLSTQISRRFTRKTQPPTLISPKDTLQQVKSILRVPISVALNAFELNQYVDMVSEGVASLVSLDDRYVKKFGEHIIPEKSMVRYIFNLVPGQHTITIPACLHKQTSLPEKTQIVIETQGKLYVDVNLAERTVKLTFYPNGMLLRAVSFEPSSYSTWATSTLLSGITRILTQVTGISIISVTAKLGDLENKYEISWTLGPSKRETKVAVATAAEFDLEMFLTETMRCLAPVMLSTSSIFRKKAYVQAVTQAKDGKMLYGNVREITWDPKKVAQTRLLQTVRRTIKQKSKENFSVTDLTPKTKLEAEIQRQIQNQLRELAKGVVSEQDRKRIQAEVTKISSDILQSAKKGDMSDDMLMRNLRMLVQDMIRKSFEQAPRKRRKLGK